MSFNPQNYYLKRVGDCDFKIHYRNVSFNKKTTTFGRLRESDVILKNVRCSLNHCKIEFEDGRMFLEDVGSSAGTFVDNVLVHKRRVELFENTIIGMGADPNRPDHVNKVNFYIYKVVKVEPAIELSDDDDDDDFKKEPFSDIPISSPRPYTRNMDSIYVYEYENTIFIGNSKQKTASKNSIFAYEYENTIFIVNSNQKTASKNLLQKNKD